MQIDYSIDELLTQLAEWEASDLHLTVGAPPVVRIRGSLEHVENLPPLGPEDAQQLLYRVLTTEQQKLLELGGVQPDSIWKWKYKGAPPLDAPNALVRDGKPVEATPKH